MYIFFVCVLFFSNIYAMHQERNFESLVQEYKATQPWATTIPNNGYINGLEIMQYFPKSSCARTVDGTDWYYDSSEQIWKNIRQECLKTPKEIVHTFPSHYNKMAWFKNLCIKKYVYYHKQSDIKIIVDVESLFLYKLHLAENTPRNHAYSTWIDADHNSLNYNYDIKDIIVNDSGTYCAFSLTRSRRSINNTKLYIKVLQFLPGTVLYEGNDIRDDLLNKRFQMGDLGTYGSKSTILNRVKNNQADGNLWSFYSAGSDINGSKITSFLLSEDNQATMSNLRFNDDDSLEIFVQEADGNLFRWHITPEGEKTKHDVFVYNTQEKLVPFQDLHTINPTLSFGDLIAVDDSDIIKKHTTGVTVYRIK